MTDRFVISVFRAATGLSMALGVLGSIAVIAAGHLGFWVENAGPFTVSFSAFFGVLVWMVSPRQNATERLDGMASESDDVIGSLRAVP